MIITIVCTTFLSLGGYLSVTKILIPEISKFFKYIANKKYKSDSEKLNINNEINNLEEKNNKLYENQIDFLLTQVENYQQQIIKKQLELNEINTQFDEVKEKLLVIQKELFDTKLINQEFTCSFKECPNRNRL